MVDPIRPHRFDHERGRYLARLSDADLYNRKADHEKRRQFFIARVMAEQVLEKDKPLDQRKKRPEGTKPLDLIAVRKKYDELNEKYKNNELNKFELEDFKKIVKYIKLKLEQEKSVGRFRKEAEELAKKEEIEEKEIDDKFASMMERYQKLIEKKKADWKPPQIHPDQTHKVLENGDIEITLPDGGTIITDASTVEISYEDLKEHDIDGNEFFNYLFEVKQRERREERQKEREEE